MADVEREIQAVPGAISMVGIGTESERNKDVARRFLEETLINRNMAILHDLAAEDLVVHHPTLSQPLHGREAYKQFLLTYFAPFPTWEITFGDIIAEGNKVAIAVDVRARGQGNFHGIDTMGKEVHWTTVRILQIEEGKIAQTWSFENTLMLLDGLGVNPLEQT